MRIAGGKAMNVVVLRGSLSRAPRVRALQSGDQLVMYDLTTRRHEERADTVPVIWFDPPHTAAELDAGAEVVVVGRVRRRFYRAGERTQSVTEVVADDVRPAGATRRVRAALRRVEATITEVPAKPSG